MPKKRQFASKILYVGTIESHLHYGIWAKTYAAFQCTCDGIGTNNIKSVHRLQLANATKQFFLKRKLNTLLAVVIISISDLEENRFYGVESDCIKRIIEQTPDEIWKRVEIYQKYTESYLFGITSLLVQERL
ncbi:5464_t:CDS:2, partial [Scutellospora calospora]